LAALDLRKRRLDHDDPLAAKREAKAPDQLANAKMMRFGECAEADIAAHRDGCKNAVHAQQWPSTLQTYVYPVIGDLSVQAVDTALVMKILEPIWKTKSETAARVRARIERVLDWATTSGYRQGDNPARWRGHIKNLLPPISTVHRVEHLPALPYRQIGAFMAELPERVSIASRARGCRKSAGTAAQITSLAQYYRLPPRSQ
jgi:hypothetical protein